MALKVTVNLSVKIRLGDECSQAEQRLTEAGDDRVGVRGRDSPSGLSPASSRRAARGPREVGKGRRAGDAPHEVFIST